MIFAWIRPPFVGDTEQFGTGVQCVIEFWDARNPCIENRKRMAVTGGREAFKTVWRRVRMHTRNKRPLVPVHIWRDKVPMP